MCIVKPVILIVMKKVRLWPIAIMGLLILQAFISCKPKNAANAISGDAATKTYVAPGKYDEFYNFVSGGFSGQLSVYGLPSGKRYFRLLFNVQVLRGR